MLANPIPDYGSPSEWGVVLIAMLAEVGIALILLRRFGLRDLRFAVPLLFINVLTWGPLFAIYDAARDGIVFIAVSEVVVVLVEAFLVGMATHGELPLTARFRRTPVSFPQALLVSAAGNATSLLVAIALRFLFRLNG